MVEWVTGYTEPWWETIDFIIPAPHHPSTIKRRGFNPPYEIAKVIAESFPIPALPNTLYKIRETPPQAKLKGAERLRNIHESMFVFDNSILDGKTVLIIDDVMTTGATMNECARAVIKAGASKVYGFVLARQSSM
jgi:predicted amidophosphoribosyltransferase